jgi:phosphate transport system substrate-binding protein
VLLRLRSLRPLRVPGVLGRRTLVPLSVLLLAACAVLCGCPEGDRKPTIRAKGSDTMFRVAEAWAGAYEKALVIVEHADSGSGLSALIARTVDVALSSRAATTEEIRLAYERTARVPKPFVVGRDAVTVVVSKSNPLDEISLEQLREMFAEGRRVSRWSELGVSVPGCGEDRIVTVRRAETSGTSDVFRKKVLGESGDYRDETIKVETTKDLVTLVSLLPCAIGYGGLGFKSDGVKVLRIKTADGSSVDPSAGTPEVASKQGEYPLVRPLYMYTLGDPSGSVREFIDWVLSETGQKILTDLGELPARD